MIRASYKESIAALMEANKDDSEMLDFIETRVNSFVNYVAHVNFMETRIQRLGIEGITGEQWRNAVQSLDENRRSKHEVAMSAVNQLNRLATASGLPLFYDGPVDDMHRNEIGDLCQTVVGEYFNDRYTKPLTVNDLMDNGQSLAEAVNELDGQKEDMVM